MPKVEIHCGDWRDVAASWPDRCTMITDPPYGIGYRSHIAVKLGRRKCIAADRSKRRLARGVVGDDDTTERDEALTTIRWQDAAVFGPKRIDRVKPWNDPRALLIWDKGEGAAMGDLSLPWKEAYETIAIYGQGWSGPRTAGVIRATKISFGAVNVTNGRRHPNEKPLELIRELVSKAPRGIPIVDPFLGSGVTGAAAIEFGHDFYGAEIDPGHYAVALERLKNVTPAGPQVGLFGRDHDR